MEELDVVVDRIVCDVCEQNGSRSYLLPDLPPITVKANDQFAEVTILMDWTKYSNPKDVFNNGRLFAQRAQERLSRRYEVETYVIFLSQPPYQTWGDFADAVREA